MTNSTQVSFFILTAYFDSGRFKYLCFMIVMLLYVLIVASNVFLIVVICMNRSLHEPMYLFLCSLFVNELFGSTALFPFLLLQILSDVHTVSVSGCLLQIFCLYSYGVAEYLNLAVMSYDRYVSICYPLQYNTCMTHNKVIVLIVLIWLLTFLLIVSTLLVILHLQLCKNLINKVYCDAYPVVKLACSDTTVNNIFALSVAAVSVFGPSVLIVYTYVRILKVCFSGSQQTRQKAVSTCTPHLASLLNFTFGVSFEFLQSRFNMNRLPNTLRIVLSLYFLICPPLFNPLMYGLKLSKIRVTVKSMMSN